MKVEWKREVFGRQVGQIEDIDPKQEPRVEMWLRVGVAVKVGKAAKEKPREDGNG